MDIQLGYWRWKIHRWNEHPNPFRGRPDLAREWLGRFQADRLTMAELRDLLDGGAPRWVDDQQVLDEVAARLSSGQLHVCAQPSHPFPHEVPDVGVAQQAPAPAKIARKPPPPPKPSPPPPDEPTLSDGVDTNQLASGLTTASKHGNPFCEECSKEAEKPLVPSTLAAPAQERQIDHEGIAANMKQASADGSPFCEECLRAEKAQHR